VTDNRLLLPTGLGALTKLIAVLAVFVLVGTGCSQAATPLDDEVARLFDIGGNRIADLTPADGAEAVPTDAIQQAIARADSAGTALRVVVVGPDAELVPAKAIVDRYGGTAISYKANDVAFQGASRDLSAAQLDRAIGAAKNELDIGDSAAAFARVLETEGLESASGASTSRTIWWILLGLAGAFMLAGAYSYWKARKRRLKRQRAFAERKQTLNDWASQLGPEVESLREPVAASSDDLAQGVWRESQEFVSGIIPTLQAARSAGELDAAEMRIGRVAIRLRDLRRSLES